MADTEPNADLDLLADFIVRAAKTGDVNMMKALQLPAALKRQAGNLNGAVGHIVRRYALEDDKAAALIQLAAMQSPAFKQLAERWGLLMKDAEPAQAPKS